MAEVSGDLEIVTPSCRQLVDASSIGAHPDPSLFILLDGPDAVIGEAGYPRRIMIVPPTAPGLPIHGIDAAAEGPHPERPVVILAESHHVVAVEGPWVASPVTKSRERVTQGVETVQSSATGSHPENSIAVDQQDPGNIVAQRVGILQDSLSDLDQLLPELSDPAFGYFERLRKVGSTLLETVA